MKISQVIPVIRIFDTAKAREFYLEWLGFKVNWEHRFEDGLPLYMEIERDGMVFHLSEHHGDGSPGTHIFTWCQGLEDFHSELLAKNYPYARPGLETTFYNARCVTVHDPFSNVITFNEKLEVPRA